MKVQPIHCPSCLAVVEVAPGVDRATCEYCGTTSIVEYSEGHASLRLKDDIVGLRRTVMDSTAETSRRIQAVEEGVQKQLKHSRLMQELTRVEKRLDDVKSQTYALQGITDKRAKKEVKGRLASLQKEAAELTIQRTQIKKSIYELEGFEPGVRGGTGKKNDRGNSGCLGLLIIWILSFLVLAVVFGAIVGDPIFIPAVLSLLLVWYIRSRKMKKGLEA